MKWSGHAQDRVVNRLRLPVNLIGQINNKIEGITFQVGETWVKVASLKKSITIGDGRDVIGGDTLYVIYKRKSDNDSGVVATVELRYRSQPVKGDYYIE